MFQTAVAAVLPVLAQAPAEPPVFRSTTRLVQMNVVVQKDGRPVPDLKTAEFQISENGKPQKIAYFSMERRDRLVHAPVDLPKNVFSNRFGERAAVPASVTVVLLDALNTAWGDQAAANQQVIRFLRQIQPHDRVALYSLGRGLRVLHDYTSDASTLVERLKKWRGNALGDLEASTISQDMRAEAEAGLIPLDFLQAEQTFANFIAANRTLNTLAALKVIAEHLAAVPGRKNLVWVSGGFPLAIGYTDLSNASEFVPPGRGAIDQRTFFDEMTSTVRALNHANVAIYPVDARGLIADPRLSAVNRSAPSDSTFSPSNIDTMIELSERTGGKAFYNRNDIDGAIREVFAETEVTYTLAYYTSIPEMDGKFRDLRVRVNRPGVQLRYRKGYFALAQMKPDDEKGVARAVSDAVWSPLDATAMAVNARADYVEDGRKVRVVVQVDPGACTLDPAGDRWHGRLDYAVVQKDETGKMLDVRRDTARMHMRQETLDSVRKSGILYEHTMDVKPGVKAIRIVVRDAPSGLIGSITVPVSQVRP